MTEECELLRKCGFLQKYQAVKDLACRGFIRLYCRGPRMNECKRKQYRAEYGVPPSDDMMPSGQPILISLRGPDDETAANDADTISWSGTP
ncbi:MAG TPA: hypothetical protein VJL29_02575 [Thermoguttaceae bacterium]|nr:hypothetical protein [Thermoguttaceae bacterium]